MAINLAIFASGGGSNAEIIINHFDKDPQVDIKLIISNNDSAYVLERAVNHNIPSHVIDKSSFYDTDKTLLLLESQGIDLIILAGFLWLVPQSLISQYSDRIINIHPSLLPRHGGKGMYGKHVHQSVFDSGDKETGITIHLVNKDYDKGRILVQKNVILDIMDTPDIVASKVLELEHKNFSPAIADYIKSALKK